MGAEIGTILGYPLSDPIGFVVLAIFTGLFALGTRIAPPAVLFSEGVLYAYSFYALSRVSDGDLRPVMPDFTELGDLLWPLQLAAATFVISWTPAVLALLYAFESGASSPPVVFLVALAVLWGVVYTPAAMTVAAMTDSTLATLDPRIGIVVIRRMGSIYWQALTICILLQLAGGFVAYVIGFLPLLGIFISPFVRAYSALAIGCTLGLAFFKRSAELDLWGA